MIAPSKPLDLLKANLQGANKVARRLIASLARVAKLMPLDATKIDAFGEDDEERLDAFIFRFNSLTAMVQDHITRGILLCEEEDAHGSKRDQRHSRSRDLLDGYNTALIYAAAKIFNGTLDVRPVTLGDIQGND